MAPKTISKLRLNGFVHRRDGEFRLSFIRTHRCLIPDEAQTDRQTDRMIAHWLLWTTCTAVFERMNELHKNFNFIQLLTKTPAYKLMHKRALSCKILVGHLEMCSLILQRFYQLNHMGMHLPRHRRPG